MRVTIVFPTGEAIRWGFAGAVPRKGDAIDFSDPAAPRTMVRVEDVNWIVTGRGCGEVRLLVR
jgi:hypothetical protein